MTVVDRVLRECRRWGIEVVPYKAVASAFDPADPLGFSKRITSAVHYSPVPGLALEWPSCRIQCGSKNAAALLHELAHCIVGVDPDEVNEVQSAMLGFEWLMQRRLRVANWQRWMRDFCVDIDLSLMWSEITTHRKHELLEASIAVGIREGLLTADRKPTYRRILPCGG